MAVSTGIATLLTKALANGALKTKTERGGDILVMTHTQDIVLKR